MKISDDLVQKVRAATASPEELKELGAENVYAIKGDLGYPNYRTVVKAPTSLKRDKRTIQHEASNEGQDRMGDVISVKGWDLANFSLNPLLLWAHQKDQPPIGRVVEARKARLEGGSRKALLSTSKFHDEEKNPFAEMIWKMVADGDLPAVSVGFLALDVLRPKSPEEAVELGVGEYGVKFVTQELLELSVVTVPAKADAVARKLDDMAEAGAFSWDLINGMKEAMPHLREKLEAAAGQRVKQFVDFGRRLVTIDEIASTSPISNYYNLSFGGNDGLPHTSTGTVFEPHSEFQPGLAYEPLKALDDEEVIDRVADRVVEKLIESDALAPVLRASGSGHKSDNDDSGGQAEEAWSKILDGAITKVADKKEDE